MTVSTTTTKNSAAGNGSTTAFTYSFVIIASTELDVYIRTDATGVEVLKTEDTHYTVSGVGSASGGTVTFTGGNIPASGETVVLLRDTPLTQATAYVENDPFPSAAHEDALDKLTHQVQELQEEVDRSLKASKTVTDLTTPEFKDAAAVRAGKFLAFDSDGDELTVSDPILSDAIITSPADAHILLYDNGDTRWENKAVSGDIAITAAGVASIASGVIVNADVNASAAIADSKLATISTADKVSGAAVQVDGAADGTGITVADATKLLVDDGGTTKYVNASQINSYVSAAVAADDVSLGNAAASFATSSGAVLVDSQASTATIDGHTGVTVQSSNSGDITLDSVADINLDAAGNDITLKAGGTHFGSLTNSSSDLVIEAKVADKDILFKGMDDSSAVTALALDMSDAGKATFSGSVVVTGDLTVSGDDIVMATNTSGAALIGDGTNFNPVVISGDISIGTDGAAAIGSGVIVNADVSGSAAIADTKLDTISTANKVGLAALDIDGGTEIGEAIVDADLFIIDNGAGGTNRKVLASRLKTYAGGGAAAAADTVAKTSTYSILAGDDQKSVLCSGGNFTINLTAAATLGDGFTVTVKKTSVVGMVTIDANGSETIDGLLTLKLRQEHASVTLICDGSNFHIRHHSNIQVQANAIQNPAMLVDQYAHVTRTGLAANVFLLDRWKFQATGSSSARYTMSVESGGGIDGKSSWQKYLVTTADGSPGANEGNYIQQAIIGNNGQAFLGTDGFFENGVLSMDMIIHADGGSSISFPAKVALTLATQDGTARQFLDDVSIAAADTWQRISLVIPEDGTSDIDPGITAQWSIRISLGAGSGQQGTAGSWATGNGTFVSSNTDNIADATNNYLGFTNVVLTPGQIACSYADVARTYEEEFDICEYYFQKFHGVDGSAYSNARTESTVLSVGSIFFHRELRAAPTIVTSGTATDYKVHHSGATDTACSATPTIYYGSQTTHTSLLFRVASGLVIDEPSQNQGGGANSFLGFSAEI
jgi:hypothetical protein